MALRSNEFGNCMAEGGLLGDVKDGVRVFSVVDAAVVEDDGEEVETGGFEEGNGRGTSEIFDVSGGYVADNVLVVVNDTKGRDAFAIHETEGIADFSVTTGKMLAVFLEEKRE
jgi:hypothetical protein